MAEIITGAEALIRCLIAEGVDRIFGYPGGSIINTYDKLYDYQDKITHVLARHEQGAIHAAEGYSRVTNRPGVVIVTSGPGAANVVTGLSDAMLDSTPIVAISGQVGSKFLGSDSFQETDVVGITLPITKWSLQVRKAADIPAAVAKAFYIAASGRPGPVMLDISKDAQVGKLEWNGYEKLRFIRSYNPRPYVPAKSIIEAAELINASKRPLILTGHGVMIAGAEKELVEFAEKGDIPVAATLLGLSTIPSDHPLFKGMLGMHGNIGPNYMTNQADLLIAVGMRFDDRITADIERYAPNAKKIHIDIDSSEFNRNINVDLAIHGDALDVLRQLTPMIDQQKRTEWCATFDACNAVEDKQVKARELSGVGQLKMGEVIDKVAKATEGKAVLVTDVGQNQMMSARYFKYTLPRSIVTSGGLGTMGFGLPAAIGAKMGAPERMVCLFCGDGGFQMTIEELGTIMQYGTAVKIIVLNNSFLGNVRQWQELFFKGRYSQTQMVNPDFVMIANAYGIKGENVTNRDDLDAAIERMLEHDGAYVLNVSIDSGDNVFPMVPLGASVSEIMLNKEERFVFPSENLSD